MAVKRRMRRLVKHAFSVLARDQPTESNSCLVDVLVAAGEACLADGTSGRTVLHEAARLGRADACRIILDTTRYDCEVRDNLLKTPLMEAAASGNVDVCKMLLGAGACPDTRRPNGWRPLLFACVAGEQGAAKTLLEAGAHPNTTNAEGASPLHLAARSGSIPCVELLLQAGADASALSDNGRGAWQAAASKGHTGVLQLLLEAKAPIWLGDKGGLTIAHEAAAAGRLEVLQWMCRALAPGPTHHVLVARGGTDADKELDMPCSGTEHDRSMAITSIEAGGDGGGAATTTQGARKETDATGCTPVRCTLMHRLAEARDTLGRTPLHSAALEGRTEVLRWMLGPRMEYAQPSGGPSEHAQPSGSYSAIETGGTGTDVGTGAADVEDRDPGPGGEAVLPYAPAPVAFSFRTRCVDSPDLAGCTPLVLAASNGRAASVEVLLGAGADPEGRATGSMPRSGAASGAGVGGAACGGGGRGGSRLVVPLKAAVGWKRLECALLLLRHGADAWHPQVQEALGALREGAGVGGGGPEAASGTTSSSCGGEAGEAGTLQGGSSLPGEAEAVRVPVLPAPLLRQAAASAAFSRKAQEAKDFLSGFDAAAGCGLLHAT